MLRDHDCGRMCLDGSHCQNGGSREDCPMIKPCRTPGRRVGRCLELGQTTGASDRTHFLRGSAIIRDVEKSSQSG